MTYVLTQPPASEPVTLAEAKAFLRIDNDDEDGLIGDLIAIARQHLEAMTGLSLMTQGWRLYRDFWPKSGMISLAHGPVQAVTAVTVYDASGEPEAVDLSGARLDGHGRPARYHLSAINAGGLAMNGIEVDFTAGFGTAGDVPDAAKAAILRHVAEMFSFRGAVALADQPAAVPDGYERLIAPLKRWRL